jgi:hypothetical protein
VGSAIDAQNTIHPPKIKGYRRLAISGNLYSTHHGSATPEGHNSPSPLGGQGKQVLNLLLPLRKDYDVRSSFHCASTNSQQINIGFTKRVPDPVCVVDSNTALAE